MYTSAETRCIALVLCLLVLLPVTADARTWRIEDDGTGDAPTIQAGIDSAASGDTLMLADGVYSGPGDCDITYGGKAVTVMSASSDPEVCIIACSPDHRGFLFDSGEGPGSVLSGVSITGGGMDLGGGLSCQGTSPTLTNTVLSGNYAWGAGGGMACTGGAAPTLTNVLFENNHAMDGAGLYCDGSSPVLTNVTFRGNGTDMPGSGGGLLCTNGGSPELTDVRFEDNSADGDGGGMLCINGATPILIDVIFLNNGAMVSGGGLCTTSNMSLTSCTFFSNGAASFGSAIAVWGGASPTIERTVITNSTLPEPVYVQGGSNPIFLCCNIWGNYGGDWVGRISGQLGDNGNISANPLFCDTDGGNLSVESCSPCLPGNHPDEYDCGGVIGALGGGCPCGAGTEAATWGTIKGKFR
jgi:hypothetical protein